MPLKPGTRLGNYEVLSELGSGGMDSPRRIKRKSFDFFVIITDSLFGLTTERGRRGFLVAASQWRWGECDP